MLRIMIINAISDDSNAINRIFDFKLNLVSRLNRERTEVKVEKIESGLIIIHYLLNPNLHKIILILRN
jgi:hypothetical protein